METLVHLGLLNAALATVLALLAAAARLVCRRPAVIHGLWLIVLLKLITPPLLPIQIASWPDSEQSAQQSPPVVTPARSFDVGPANPAPETTMILGASAAPTAAADPDARAVGYDAPCSGAPNTTEETPIPAREAHESPQVDIVCIDWEQIVAAVWLSGSLLWWAIAGVRLVRFRNAMRSATPAPAALQERTKRLAVQLGLSRCPRVYLLPVSVMPMLWAVIGEPCLLLPAVLWARLSREQQDTLLAHELAHLRRGDPWVRRLELVVLGLYWWHPIVWWARHEIEEAGEQCCDAWVLWSLPTATETYASALLETVAYLSRLRPALPLGASGAGHTHLLRRRLTMILQGTTPRTLTWGAFAAFLACGAVVLPMRPSWAQAPAAKTTVQQPVNSTTGYTSSAVVATQDTTPGTKITGTATSTDQGLTGSIVIPRDIEEAKDAVELLQAQLESKKAELLEARALLQQSRHQVARQEQLRQRGAIAEEEVEQTRTELTVREARVQAKEAQVKEADVRPRQANRALSRLHSGGLRSRTSFVGQTSSSSTKSAATQLTKETVGNKLQSATGGASYGSGTTVETAKAAAGPGGSLTSDLNTPVSADVRDTRLRNLEIKLEQLLKEVETLRSEIRRQRTGGSSSAPSDPNLKNAGKQ